MLANSRERALKQSIVVLERDAVIAVSPDCVVLSYGAMRLLSAHLRVELLRSVWRRAGWPEGSMTARRWQRLGILVRNAETTRVSVGARVEVSTEGSFVVLRRRDDSQTSAVLPSSWETAIPLTLPGLTPVPWAHCAIELRLDPDSEPPPDETIDLDRIAQPLFVRPPSPGDRFAPLGMGGKTMALADFFRGRRLARKNRIETPLVCDQLGIVWVAGHRIADRVKALGETQHALGLRIVQGQG
jgi:tRNA(Ile)-lysidine synthase